MLSRRGVLISALAAAVRSTTAGAEIDPASGSGETVAPFTVLQLLRGFRKRPACPRPL